MTFLLKNLSKKIFSFEKYRAKYRTTEYRYRRYFLKNV